MNDTGPIIYTTLDTLTPEMMLSSVSDYDLVPPDATGDPLSIGPSVHFPPSEKYTFDQLTDKLIELERKHGYSSLEMFRRYVHGDYDEEETIEDWFSFFFLYLGTDEVRYWSSP